MSEGVILVSPTEPTALRNRPRWYTSSLPERNGVDAFWAAQGKLWGVQRKEISDLLASRSDGRLEVELGQMKVLDVAVLVVEGRLRWTTDGELVDDWMQLSRRQLRGMLWTVRNRGVWVEYTKDTNDTGELIEELMSWSQKDRHSGLRGRPGPQTNWGHVADKDWAVHLLTSFKGIGPGVAGQIYEHFSGIPLTWDVTAEELMKVDGIGKVRAQALIAALERSEG